MRGTLASRRIGVGGALFVIGLLAHTPAAAQEMPAAAEPTRLAVDARGSDNGQRPLLAETDSREVKDPTTYLTPLVVYTTHRLDWDSSQKLFAYGYLEANPKFTISGRANDVPIGYAAGKRKILRYSLSTIGNSLVNNAACAIVERQLIERNPQHRKLIRTLGWIERGIFNAYWAEKLSRNQRLQWQDNNRVLADLRFRGVPQVAAGGLQ
jgi:hypothetical protein